MENREALLALNAIEGLGPRVLIQLLHRFGSPAELLQQNRKLLQGLVGATLAGKIAGWKNHFDLTKELRECKARRVEYLDWNDERYPECLRHIPQPPPVLYYQGQFQKKEYGMGIVGSRQASRYGVDVAKRLAKDLVATGFTVVSGMARGIDTAAHEGALEAAGRTIAVLGSGFADPYPKENVLLMKCIAAGGLVLSEFPLNRPPLSRNFPRRNRIISGVAMGVVVVEAARRSGSLITASHALEQGRSIFAVPGRLDSESSQGANSLIQQGAKLISCAADIVEDLQYLLPARFHKALPENRPVVSAAARTAPELSKAQQKIVEALETEPTGIEEIIKVTGLSAPEVAGGLLALEMHGLVEQFPGKNFAKPSPLRV